jgi:hypothetical protein
MAFGNAFSLAGLHVLVTFVVKHEVVAYLLHGRTVESEKQSLLSNDSARPWESCVFHGGPRRHHCYAKAR